MFQLLVAIFSSDYLNVDQQSCGFMMLQVNRLFAAAGNAEPRREGGVARRGLLLTFFFKKKKD